MDAGGFQPVGRWLFQVGCPMYRPLNRSAAVSQTSRSRSDVSAAGFQHSRASGPVQGELPPPALDVSWHEPGRAGRPLPAASWHERFHGSPRRRARSDAPCLQPQVLGEGCFLLLRGVKAQFQVLGLLSLLALTARADSRSSANYSITTDTIDTGGARSTSTAYTSDGAIGGVTGIGTVPSPAQTAKHGYIGQLYDITGVTLHTGGVSSLNEGATLQLGASLAMDDATSLQLAPSSVAWSVLSGPISSISAGGLLTAGAVYQDTAAQVQGGHSGLNGTASLTVLESVPDNFGSYAGDGLPDDWQVSWFGLNNPQAAPNADPTGGGQNNLFKYVAGLDPTDINSRFSLGVGPVPGQPGQKRITFSPLVPGRSYTVRYQLDLGSVSWQTLTGTSASDNGTERTVTDPDATGPAKFYQIQISKP